MKELRITRLTWANVSVSESPKLELSDGRRCEENAWDATAFVILDAPGGGEGATLGAPEKAHQLLETIVRRRLPVRISSNRRNRHAGGTAGPANCSLEMVWAVQGEVK